ncbi:hypothetical protein R3I93_020187 [Phoxinus phoxinus]|uniref:Uncharacterized protein n=1 Tax=Phoxinus phoxinus TaxID=58324 RepID=A0AAN9C9X6_9TELE
MALAATSGGIFLTGLMGFCLFCIRQKPRKKSPMKTSVAAVSQSPDEDDTEDNEKHSEEHEEKLYHVYCTIPDDSVDTHMLYSLAQMPNHSLLI